MIGFKGPGVNSCRAFRLDAADLVIPINVPGWGCLF
jgi:hypothetical protein